MFEVFVCVVCFYTYLDEKWIITFASKYHNRLKRNFGFSFLFNDINVYLKLFFPIHCDTIL